MPDPSAITGLKSVQIFLLKYMMGSSHVQHIVMLHMSGLDTAYGQLSLPVVES